MYKMYKKKKNLGIDKIWKIKEETLLNMTNVKVCKQCNALNEKRA